MLTSYFRTSCNADRCADNISTPGKTAPRLIKDLFDYDARRSRRQGENVLIDPQAIYREGGKHLPPRAIPNDCPHQLRRKDFQSFLPAVDERPSATSKYISASYCCHCLWHFDVIADFTRRPGRNIPCQLDTDFPLHHFQYVRTQNRANFDKNSSEKYDNFKEIHTFTCSNPASGKGLKRYRTDGSVGKTNLHASPQTDSSAKHFCASL